MKQFLLMLLGSAAMAQTYQPTPDNLKARQWFQDAKFGLFIHWGVYSVLGRGEWVMNNDKITVADYEKIPAQFNPTEFNPAEWVAMAKDAGMNYITITSKHHDGFAMWGTKQSDWDIVDRTPYHKDAPSSRRLKCCPSTRRHCQGQADRRSALVRCLRRSPFQPVPRRALPQAGGAPLSRLGHPPRRAF